MPTSSIKKIFSFFSTLRFALSVTVFLIILLIIGAFAQVNSGTLVIQEKIFRSFFIYWEPYIIPIFPGGYLLGLLFSINLVCSLILNHKFSLSNLGFLLIHLGVLFFVIGEALIGILSSESFLSLKKDERQNHAIALNKMELFIANNSTADSQTVPYSLPFSVELTELTQENYPGTTLPKNYSSAIDVFSTEGKYMRSALISMNNPFRYNGLTLYQAGFNNEDDESIIKIVVNPLAYLPYICSCFIVFGLFYQFTLRFFLLKIQTNRQ